MRVAVPFSQPDARVLSGGWNVAGLQNTPLQVEVYPGATVDGP